MTPLINYYDSLTKEEKIYLNEHYKRWVDSISPSKPHHVRRPPYCGMGVKPPDVFCIPVDYATHDAIHRGIISRGDEIKMLEETHREYYELYIEEA